MSLDKCAALIPDVSDAGEGHEDPGWAGIRQEAEEVWNEPPPAGGALPEQTAAEGEPRLNWTPQGD